MIRESLISQGHPTFYVPDLPQSLQPSKSPFRYPAHTKDWGIEQDFHQFLIRNPELQVSDPAAADWVYLPVYWTRIHLANDFGRQGIDVLQAAIDEVKARFQGKSFTVCQYDDGPLVDLGDSLVFLGSRKTLDGLDAPLLSSGLPCPRRKPLKKFLATFAGRTHTHPIRSELRENVARLPKVAFIEKNLSAAKYAKLLLSGCVALCPRGYGGSSFRFFEAIQLGVVPWLISDIDSRPFSRIFDWDQVSFWSPTVSDFMTRFEQIGEAELLNKQKSLQEVSAKFWFGQWQAMLLEELKTLN